MTDVTDADRGRAFRALGWHESWGLDELSNSDRNEVEDIAAALAEERAKARAPFLALADEWAGRQQVVEDLSGDKKRAGHWVRGDVAAERIRHAARETE